MTKALSPAISVLVYLVAVSLLQGQPGAVVIAVDMAHPGAAISPHMFGVFFEDINFGADGGLYPERIKNRSFEFTEPLAGWREVLPISGNQLGSPKGELDIRTDDPLNESNPHYLRMRAYDPGFALSNAGYRGIGVE